jgi:hypothetical protein
MALVQQTHGKKQSHSVCNTGVLLDDLYIVDVTTSQEDTVKKEVKPMKLTVKKAEKVATTVIYFDGIEPANPWKEAKPQCL